MPRDRKGRYESGSQWMQRSVEAFSKQLKIGWKVAFSSGSKTAAVKRIVEEYGYSERYVWKCAAIAERLEKRRKANWEAHRDPNPPRRAKKSDAGMFLITTLLKEPKSATEIFALAKNKGIARRTLHRASKYIVEKKRIGGRDGQWVWDLNADNKIVRSLYQDSQRLPKSPRRKRAYSL
jgi:hypothetical protein